ncbi:hypothetical protein [Roseomonas sp. AR75]|uniref:hypothetical protein n=1 Tax=Roseomonas sp. AR75 TaxID=2562311 RepID=UPI0010C127D5|nr:hypothetical protein [Roseomonas sp. AR75]
MTRPLRFFLGGQDLEMATIADLVRTELGEAALADKRLPWGARAEAYAPEISAWRAQGGTAVLVELPAEDPPAADLIMVDHHGDRAAEPSALRQVFDLLGLPPERWTRHFALVEANDVGHVAAMRALGASEVEMKAIRAADRAAQGVTAAEEDSGRAALAAARATLGGRLLVVTLPHGRSATVMDPLALGLDDATRDVLLLTPSGPQFFGDGRAVAALNRAFPGGWRGGSLPQRGFWGVGRVLPEPDLLAALEPALGGR